MNLFIAATAIGAEPSLDRRSKWLPNDGRTLNGDPVRSGYERGLGPTYVFLLNDGTEEVVPKSAFSESDHAEIGQLLRDKATTRRTEETARKKRQQQRDDKRRQDAERRAQEQLLNQNPEGERVEIAKVALFAEDYVGKTVCVKLWVGQDSFTRIRGNTYSEFFLGTPSGGWERFNQVPWFGNSTSLESNGETRLLSGMNILFHEDMVRQLIDRIPASESWAFECDMRLSKGEDADEFICVIEEMRGQGVTLTLPNRR